MEVETVQQEELEEGEVEDVTSEEETEEKEDSNDEDYVPQEHDEIFKEKIDISAIADLFELCKSTSGSRNLSVLLYSLLRHLGLSWRRVDDILSSIGAFRCANAHRWAEVFVSEDFSAFVRDDRGGKQSDSFYDTIDGLEEEAKAFAIEGCSRKASNFSVGDLARFIDHKYYEITGETKVDSSFIRSESSCRLDLRRWGAKFQANSQRPYFEGHERADVVAQREEFVSSFLARKKHYYTVKEGDDPSWQSPTAKKPCILICHDESTFRSGEVSAKRWIMENHSPFFNKGKGRSFMVSDFLVSHVTGPFLTLSDSEFAAAVKEYPELKEDKEAMYKKNSATAGITIGQDAYFNNETVLAQFERLFQLVKHKKEFKGHEIEVLVDNARTHTAKEYSIHDFAKGVGKRCPVDFLEWSDDRGKQQKISCYFGKGENKRQSKGLRVLAEELKVVLPAKANLNVIKSRLSEHPAFKNVSKLEQLATKYKVRVIFGPKYHCETNPIEGMWAHMKRYVRCNSDQTFPTMLKLIDESRENFKQKGVHLKLFRRFWKTLEAYKEGKTYAEVLTFFFSNLCKSDIQCHRRITNTKLDQASSSAD